jgi:hypothetical protein
VIDDGTQLSLAFRAAILTAFADGKPGAEEMQFLKELTRLYPGFGELKDARALMLDTYQLIKTQGMEACIDTIARGLTDRRYQELAFKLSAQMMAADGTTDAAEAMLLGELQERFQFTAEDVKRLLAT